MRCNGINVCGLPVCGDWRDTSADGNVVTG